MKEITPYSKILDILTDLVENMTSGTLFVHSECNHAITIALTRGQIHATYFGPKKGRSAITLISQITGGSYRFEKNNLLGTSHNLPNTAEILKLLRNPNSNSKTITSYTAPSNNREITDSIKTTLRQNLKREFTMHLGPIADMLFDDIAEEVGDFCATPELAEIFINKLTEEIENSSHAESFNIKCSNILNNILNY